MITAEFWISMGDTRPLGAGRAWNAPGAAEFRYVSAEFHLSDGGYDPGETLYMSWDQT